MRTSWNWWISRNHRIISIFFWSIVREVIFLNISNKERNCQNLRLSRYFHRYYGESQPCINSKLFIGILSLPIFFLKMAKLKLPISDLLANLIKMRCCRHLWGLLSIWHLKFLREDTITKKLTSIVPEPFYTRCFMESFLSKDVTQRV